MLMVSLHRMKQARKVYGRFSRARQVDRGELDKWHPKYRLNNCTIQLSTSNRLPASSDNVGLGAAPSK